MRVSCTQYLHRSEHYIFYYRRAIPNGLRKAFGGKCEVKQSLKTRDKSEATIRHHELNLEVERLFVSLKREMSMSEQLDPLYIVGLKQDAVAAAMEGESAAVMSGVVMALRGQPLRFESGKVVLAAPIKVESDKLLRLDGSEVDGFIIPTALAYADSVGIPKMIDEAVFIPEGIFDVKVKWSEPTQEQIAMRVKEEEEKLKKLGLLDDFLRITTAEVVPAAPVVAVAAQHIQTVIEKPQPLQSSNDALQAIKFSALVEKFLKHKTRWSKGTRDAARSIFDVFLDLKGDIDVSEINHPMMIGFIETLQDKVPANVKKVFPNLTIKEITRLNHKKAGRKMMSPCNINKYIGKYSQLFQYALGRGYMDFNYAENKRLEEPVHAKDQRERFSESDIQCMFTKIEPWMSNNRVKPETFWINLIGAFTGARLGEICQLRAADVYEAKEGKASMWVFDIHAEESGMRVKNRNSIRQVPVHSQLIKMGLLDYVKERKALGKELLWDITPDSKGTWSGNMSKRFCYLFKKNGISNSFHSWRHTVSDVLMKDNDVRKDEQEALVGHALAGESYGRYGKGFSLITLKATVEAINYDVDWKHLIAV